MPSSARFFSSSLRRKSFFKAGLNGIKNEVDIGGQSAKFFPLMKSDMTNTVLVFALGVFAALDVLFAVRAVVGQRELRTLQTQANQAQVGMVQLQQLRALVVDVQEYSR